MGNVKFQLNLNKHPKDCPNYSLVNATNVRVSDDFSCLQNEESITGNKVINDKLDSYHGNISIIGTIACNKELIIFVNTGLTPIYDEDAYIAEVLRYNEETNTIVTAYNKLKYYNGKIIGTFTYNVNNELIIAFSEYDGTKDVPLKTINLGVWDGTDDASKEKDFSDGKLAMSPEIHIPSLSSFDYISGNSYKGWYYYFIRYKINKNDYTKWYPLGYPIFITALEFRNIFKYGLNGGTRNGSTIIDNFYLNGISDHFSSKEDITDESVSLQIQNIDTNYDYFQIGFSCISKTYSKAFRTSDIEVSSSYIYEMNISNCIDYSVNELILENYNYYNVKNVINYKNRLYISNYKESKDPDINEEELNKIKLTINRTTKDLYDVKLRHIDTDAEENPTGIFDGEENDYIPTAPNLYPFSGFPLSVDSYIYLDKTADFSGCYILTHNNIKIYPSSIIKTYNSILDTYKYDITFNIDGNSYKVKIESDSVITTNAPFRVKLSDFTTDIYISSVFKYINTNSSFNTRKKESTLIPGETYSFYIHFVDKYGETTKGYKLQNTVKFRLIGSNIEYFPIEHIQTIGSTATIKYLLTPLNQNIFNNNTIDLTNLVLADYSSYDLLNNTYIFSQSSNGTVSAALNSIGITKFNSSIYNLKWYDLYHASIYSLSPSSLPFSIYINNAEDKLFKVPDCSYGYKQNLNTHEYYLTAYRYTLNFNLNDFTLPEGYVGYYFSYEKFESTKKVNGILCKADIFHNNSISDKYINYDEVNINSLSHIHFYSSYFDTKDDIDLDYNCIKVNTSNFSTHIVNDSENFVYASKDKDLLISKYPINYNLIELPANSNPNNHNSDFININIENPKLKYANKVIDGTLGVGTVLEIPLNDGLKYLYENEDAYTTYRASLLKINKNIYTNENKVLIKFSNIYYSSTISGNISNGLNGHITYQGTLIYNYNKFNLSAENVILTEKYNPYYPCPVFEGLNDRYIGDIRHPIAYIQQLWYDDILYETKSFKNEPKVLTQNIELPTNKANDIVPFAINSIVAPLDSVDLFQELQTNQDKLNPKTYITKSDNKEYITQFDKRIQRSNVIADESLNNSWRVFPLEGYKDIAENKGKITNLIGIGTTLLAHTEHSLFAFDRSNTLQTADDNDIQLAMPDIFDVDYTEVFTSDKGVCGLQDKEAWVAGQFGYIFYDNDAHRIYKFGSKKIDIIDTDIVQFLNFNIPYRVRFAQDVERNRILISFEIYETVRTIVDTVIPVLTKYVLSYNYQLNTFISLHTYNFDKGINTKNILYLQYNNKLYCNKHDLFSTIYNNIQRRAFPTTLPESYDADMTKLYGYFENGNNKPSSISIIVNDSYQFIKTIEFLTYKLFKRDLTSNSAIIPNKIINEFDIANEREYSRTPYSGYKLRVHNDMCDTGLIDVHVDIESNKNIIMNYKKPWWEFGNWNFNYLRDTKFSDSLHDIMSRVYGNYFIIDIIFYDEENIYTQKIEFENLDVKLLVDATI